MLVNEAGVREIAEQNQENLVQDWERYEQRDYDSLLEVILPARTKGFSTGIALLRLGDCDRARDWLEIVPEGALNEVARFSSDTAYSEGLINVRVGSWFDQAFHSAVLSDTDPVIDETATRALTLLEDLSLAARDDPRCHLYVAYGEALCQNTGKAIDRVERALSNQAALADRYDRLELELSMLAGVLTDDQDRLRENAERHLDLHREMVVQNDGSTIDRAVDYRTAGFLALAHHCGTAVKIESEFIPDCIYQN